MKTIGKRQMLKLIRDSAISETEKRAFLAELISSGEITEHDIAEAIIEDIDTRLEDFSLSFQNDPLLQFLWERFHDHPGTLARALVQARPDLFYTYGFAVRLVIRLRTELGDILVSPSSSSGSESDTPEVPTLHLHEAVRKDLFRLDIECRFRDLLYFFSRDFAAGEELLELEIKNARTSYDRSVLRAVAELVRRLQSMKLPNVRQKLNDRPFPALHVRWWLDAIRDIPRCLNIGDTGTYKTSFAAIAVHLADCRRTLVISAPHARDNWARELPSYFEESCSVEVIRSEADLMNARFKSAFTIIGYSSLASSEVVRELSEIGFDALIQDECHYAKNVDVSPAKRAMASLELARALPLMKYIALSATPTENKPEELAATAAILRPELFPNPETFVMSGAAKNPRLMRELFTGQILEIEAREIRDLPEITPRPWEDLFNPIAITPSLGQRRLYRQIVNHELDPQRKLRDLLKAAIHPPLLDADYLAERPRVELSTKLAWLKRYIDERIGSRKIVVATGIFTTSVTHASDEADSSWIGGLFSKWYGTGRVLCIDETVGIARGNDGDSARESVIRRWRSDPDARILLVSMQSCPDSINLSVPALPGVEGLSITSLSLSWKPWKQFLGRFWREGLGVPIEFAHPVLIDTIDEDLLRLNQEKWGAQMLFRAGAPITQREWEFLEHGGSRSLTDLQRDAVEHVNVLLALLRGKSEDAAVRILKGAYGAQRRGEALARHFLAMQEFSASGHIARFQRTVLERWRDQGLLSYEHILDAGCGPLTLERRLDAPVFGIDLNPTMIELGRAESAHQGTNALVGKLSEMPREWTGKFEVSIASMVLDLTSCRSSDKTDSERLRILRELVRVTDPHGLIWFTWNTSAHTEETFQKWIGGLKKAGAYIREELTGLVVATDLPEHAFSFWSLVFSPNGKPLRFEDDSAFRHAFEVPQAKRKVKALPREKPRAGKKGVIHERFVVRHTMSDTADRDAADRAFVGELMRWSDADLRSRRLHRSLNEILTHFSGDWRLLTDLQRRGVIQY